MSRKSRWFALGAAALAGMWSVQPATAAVVVVAHYQLGEADAGAGNGVAVGDPSVDAVGGHHLAPEGTVVYSDDTPDALGGQSSLSLYVSGSGSGLFADGIQSVGNDNWGIEGWVKVENANPVMVPFMNGSANAGGLTVFADGTGWHGLAGGVAAFGSDAPIQAGEWTHLAAVVNGGVLEFYVNGELKGTAASQPRNVSDGYAVPNHMGIGHETAIDQHQFSGWIDEVRVITFDAGAFNPQADLMLVPEPASLALVGLGALVMFRQRR